MDKDAPFHVAKNTLITSVTSALVTAFYYGAVRGEARPILLAGHAAINSGIAGATFFGLREYVVSPILVSTMPWIQYTRQKQKSQLLESKNKDSLEIPIDPLTWGEMRTHNLLDTAVSGAISGAVLNSFRRGKAGVFPGITTGALFCTVLQLGFNELSVARVKLAAGRGSPSTPADKVGTGSHS